MNRKLFLTKFAIVYIVIAGFIFFGLKIYSHKKFNEEALNQLIIGKSKYRNTTDQLCKFQILGEPKVDKNYIKINFWCNDGSKARSTFSLIAFEDKTPLGIIKEYARIIGFDFNVIKDKKWFCSLNDQPISFETNTSSVPLASTIDCYETKGLPKND